jgi:hypothetical protein
MSTGESASQTFKASPKSSAIPKVPPRHHGNAEPKQQGFEPRKLGGFLVGFLAEINEPDASVSSRLRQQGPSNCAEVEAIVRNTCDADQMLAKITNIYQPNYLFRLFIPKSWATRPLQVVKRLYSVPGPQGKLI